jgi:hypothetical protein
LKDSDLVPCHDENSDFFSKRDSCLPLTATFRDHEKYTSNEQNDQFAELERSLEKMVENCEEYQNDPSMMKTLNYFINDYNAHNLPESNPLKTVMDKFVKKRQEYFNMQKKGSLAPDAQKPTLEDFLTAFQKEVSNINKTYKQSKEQFETDMKTFKGQTDVKMSVAHAD